MKVQMKMSVVAVLLAATAAAYAVQPQVQPQPQPQPQLQAQPQVMGSAVQKRLNVIEKIKITEQKQVSANAAPVSAKVQAALNAAAAAEREAPRSK